MSSICASVKNRVFFIVVYYTFCVFPLISFLNFSLISEIANWVFFPQQLLDRRLLLLTAYLWCSHTTEKKNTRSGEKFIIFVHQMIFWAFLLYVVLRFSFLTLCMMLRQKEKSLSLSFQLNFSLQVSYFVDSTFHVAFREK